MHAYDITQFEHSMNPRFITTTRPTSTKMFLMCCGHVAAHHVLSSEGPIAGLHLASEATHRVMEEECFLMSLECPFRCEASLAASNITPA